MSTQLNYGQVGAALERLDSEDVVLGSARADKAAADLLEALLAMHNETALDLDYFPEVDALAKVIAPGDFGCCVGGTPAHGIQSYEQVLCGADTAWPGQACGLFGGHPGQHHPRDRGAVA